MSRVDQGSADLRRDIELLAKHLPIASNDNTLLVLKGHLLVEHLLTEFIRSKLPQSNHFENAQLRFPQKAALARSMGPLGPADWTWTALDKLNSVRNSLAHNLEHPKADERLRQFIDSVAVSYASDPLDGDAARMAPLPEALVSLYFALADTLRVKPYQILLAEALRAWQPSNKSPERTRVE